MYLSRIALNRHRRKAQIALAFPQMMHAAVLNSFPPAGISKVSRDKQRTLWRVDHIRSDTFLLVLSENSPDFAHMVDQFGWPRAQQTWETKDYTPLLEQLEVGHKWHFRLQGNPVHTVDGKVLPHVTIQQQKQWLLERTTKNGFCIPMCNVQGEVFPQFEIVERNTVKFKRNPNDKARVSLSTATFEGILEVTDTAIFKSTLCQGIGRAKAYGCGLLTLARA